MKKERSIADPSTRASALAISQEYEVVIAAGKLAPIKPARRLFTGTVTFGCITPSRYSGNRKFGGPFKARRWL
jgi:hypothetical protein